MALKKGLGRGFDSLIPSQVLDEQFDPTSMQDEKVSELRRLRVADISPDTDQPRRNFDDEHMHELAGSIREHGVIQPIIVTPQARGKYQIVAGERRWRAAKMVGLEKIPSLVRTLDNQHKLELSLIENIQRRDLNPLETATAYLKLHQQFNLTYEEIGQRVGGKAISTISNALRLLQLPDRAKLALVNGGISEGHARQILALDNAEAQQELLRHVIKEGWSVRKAEQFVAGYKQSGSAVKKTEAAVQRMKTESEDTKKIGKRLGTQVRLKATAKGGQLIIGYTSDDDLGRITKLLLN